MSSVVSQLPVKGSHARRRFTLQLARWQTLLDEAAATASDALPGQALHLSKARTPSFMLEALGRVYEKLDIDDSLFERIRTESKIVEDTLGAIDFFDSMVKRSKDWSMPAGVVHLAEQRYYEACGKAWAWIEAREWVPSRYHETDSVLASRMARKLKKVDWHAPQREAKLLRKWLRKEIPTIAQKIQALDLHQIEAGLHKARREVRWISIYFTALDGAFVLDKDAKSPAHWDRYLTKEIVENPFNQLPVPETGDAPLPVPAPLLYALSYLIDRLGVIKDRAQWTETLQHFLHLSGEKASLPELMGEHYLEPNDATQQGRAVIDQVLVKDKLLERLVDAW